MFEGFRNRKQEKEIQSQLIEAAQKYKRVFTGEDAEWVLKDLAKRSFDRRTINAPNEFERGINEGRRALFNYIRDMIEKDLTEMIKATTEG